MNDLNDLEDILRRNEELLRQQKEEEEAKKSRYQHKEKKSFVVYHDWSFYIDQIDDDDKIGKLFKALFTFNISGEIVDLEDSACNMALMFMVRQFERDKVKYDETCAKNKANRAKAEEYKRKREQERQVSTSVDDDDR